MKKIPLFLIIVVMVVLQATILSFFKLWQVKPDLLLACMVLVSLYFDLKWSLIFALLLGLMKDAFSPSPAGFNTVFFPVFSFLIIFLSKKLPLENIYLRLLILITAILLHSLSAVFFYAHLSWGIFLRITLLEALLTVAVAYPFFRMLACGQK